MQRAAKPRHTILIKIRTESESKPQSKLDLTRRTGGSGDGTSAARPYRTRRQRELFRKRLSGFECVNLVPEYEAERELAGA